jgi:glutamine synthetase
MTDFARPDDAALPAEAEEFLARHPNLVAFDLIFIDLNGIARGKMLRRHELLPLYLSGRHLPGSVLGLDPSGEDVDETGLIWSDGDADRRAWPIPGSLVTLPWTSPPRGEVRVCLYELNGSRMSVDPRHAMCTEIERLGRLGLSPTLAYELEFYLLSPELDCRGRPVAAAYPLTGKAQRFNEVYGVEALDRFEPFVAALYAAAEAQALPVEAMISEYAAGQFELTLRHREGGIRAADDLVMLKRLLRALAIRHGIRSNFMAKPFSDRSGSGMHLHASLMDGSTNIFADEGKNLAPLLLSAIAGLQQTMLEAMLIFAPNLNSWRRFSRNSYAPVEPSWGRNNRTVAIRVPAGDPKNRHLEHRAPGVDSNPYLVGATVLAGMRHGITKDLRPGAESLSYGEHQANSLPTSWRMAIENAASSAFLREALGERLVNVFLALKRAEYRRFAGNVTTEEFEYYADVI